MENIRQVLAQNLKENRRKLGITQPILAERAGLSTHYLGMIEIGRNFPTVDVLERLAKALGIKSNELFSVPTSPERAIEELQQAVVKNIEHVVIDSIEQAVSESIEKAFANERKNKKKPFKQRSVSDNMKAPRR